MVAVSAPMNRVTSDTHEVTIELDKVAGQKDRIKFADDKDQVVRMDLKKKLKWKPGATAAGNAFWIVFEDRTPFEKHVMSIDELGSTGAPLLPGVFKYHVVLASDPSVRLDPVIIIDPPTP